MDKKLTLYAAAEYVLPANRDLSFGVLGTYRNSSLLSWGEGRFITNWKPLSWLSGNVSFAWNSFGPAGKANITATIGAVFPL